MSPADDPRRRLLLLGDGLWAAAALRHLAVRHVLPAVVERSCPTDDSLARAAREAGLPLVRLADVNAPDAREWIRSLAPDLLLSVSYDQIFQRPLLSPPHPPVLNLHAGHPDRQRGRAVLCWQLLEGVRELELTVMRVTRGIDRGPVLGVSHVALGEDDEYGQALERVCAAVPAVLDQALAALAGERALPGDAAAQPVYYPRRRAGDEWLDWNRDSADLLRLIRALAPPNCLAATRLGERELRVRRAAACPDFPAGVAGVPGAVIGRDPVRGLLVKTGDGALWLGELWTPEGERVPQQEFHLSDRFGNGTLAELESLRRRVGRLEERLAALEGVAHAG
ncbi:MAG: formyltransferase family protein [Candidatus Delongbacteria bacterium]